jgi:hypothetical protein
MFQLVLADIIQIEREREIEKAIRRRQLPKPQDGATELAENENRRTTDAQALAVRVRPTTG